MTRQITDSVHWLNICYDTEGELPAGQHNHIASYIIEAPDGYIIIDTGSHLDEEAILDGVEEITGGNGIEAIIASHGDLPHLGNLDDLIAEWGDVDVYGPGAVPEVHGLPHTTIHTNLGEDLEIAGRRFHLVDPPLADRTHTIWVYDYASKVLFTADGFGNFHNPPEECDALSTELEDGVRFEDLHGYHAQKLKWFEYVESDRLRPVMDDLFEAYDVSYVAPIHGNPIAAEDIEQYLDRLMDSVDTAYEAYTAPQ
jgi:flavorubredoxin